MPITQFPIATVLATKALLGLGSVDNTSDLQKPISLLQQAALDQKRSLLVAVPLADLAQSGATTGQVLKWNGTAWAPGTDLVGGGGGGGAVTTVFGRTGDVTPQSNDYTFAQIGSKPTTLSGYGITDAAPSSHVGSGGSAHAAATTSVAGFMSATDKTKLDGIAAGASANSPDATLLSRANHTGSQATSTITGLDAALALLAPLANPTFTGTVNGITKSMVGLGAVDNTADASKPVSTAQAAAISARHVNIQFQDEGSNLGASGTADTVNFVGAGVTAARVSNALTVTIPGYTLPDATNLVTGGVRLTGALGGTATAPTALGYADAAALSTALAAKAPLTRVVENIATGSAYTLVVGDNGKIKRGVDSSAQTVNITTAFSGLGCCIEWLAGAGTITLDAGSGVNLNGLGDGVNIVLSQAAGAIEIIPTGTNTFDVIGALGDLVMADVTDISAAARTVLDDASVSAMVDTLGGASSTGTGGLARATSPVLVSPLLALGAIPGTDDTYSGMTITGRNAGATVAQWDAVLLGGSFTWILADANGSGTFPCQGLAAAAGSSGNPLTVVVHGPVRNDAWNWSVGPIYLSTTAGGLTQTPPSTSGDKIQYVGYATSADTMFVDPSPEYLTVS